MRNVNSDFIVLILLVVICLCCAAVPLYAQLGKVEGAPTPALASARDALEIEGWTPSTWKVSRKSCPGGVCSGNVVVKGDNVIITVPKGRRSGGEIYSVELFKYGVFEVRMKIKKVPCVRYAFFLGVFDKEPENEIDVIEIDVLDDGSAIAYSTVWWNSRKRLWTKILDFEPDEEYHTYKLEWSGDTLVFYIDGREVARFRDERVERMRKLRVLVNAYAYSRTPPPSNGRLEIDWVRCSTPTGLEVEVYNARGRSMPKTGGVLALCLYDSSWNYLGWKEVEYEGGEKSVSIMLEGLEPGKYFVETYHVPNGGLREWEFWGSEEVEVRGYTKLVFRRHSQTILRVVAVGKVEVTVANLEKYPVLTKVEVILDRDRKPPYDYRIASPPKLIKGGGTARFSLNAYCDGVYYAYVVAYSKYYKEFVPTDQSGWTLALMHARRG